MQNLLVLRFGNGIFEPLWNRNYVDHVQITAAETLGVEQRAAFYETAGRAAGHDPEPRAAADFAGGHGAARRFRRHGRAQRKDQSPAVHPAVHAGDRGARRGARAVRPRQESTSDYVPGYREEPGVAPDSATETFVAARLQIDNWRWAGVPFYLRTGQAPGPAA